MSVTALLERYLLANELKPDSELWYRRVVGTYTHWLGSDDAKDFTAENVSRFLSAKQAAGRSSYYRKSLRNGLVALLRFSGNEDRVRPVKLATLAHETWDSEQVLELIRAVDAIRIKEPLYWRTLIAAAWWSGLSECDLHRIEKRQVRRDGVVSGERAKTGKPYLTYIPHELVKHSPEGPVWPLRTSGEFFRRTFRRIVQAAKLRGTFKTLRKSSGTSVERLYPGQGHRHLANSRAIFERHYWFDHAAQPLRPEPLVR